MVQSGDFSPSSASESEVAGLYVGYALILFVVPTFGVAALIGLLRLWRAPAPTDPLARSHFIFQRRTLIASVAAIAAGGVLILVNLGVFVLFGMAVWTLVRGVLGLRDLLQGRGIEQPLRLFY
ncbi:serine/threonine protein kinase [Brevundimonas naejangsanensis]|uniref:Serine/threonine protein kinase n=1 Tax=Brevundimonas naejangsanensis TaxID=588932 RepID=A0A494RLZ6_9CAUL|nr:serine/threonine protein kinase [Brevundimonas naejangsanensis]AYG95002.1 serine/threonine protein kinase [Brevundimonas naejangsanensis]